MKKYLLSCVAVKEREFNSVNLKLSMNSSKVYYGSINHGKIAQFASLANKLDKIIEYLDFSSLSKKDKVAVKMHLGFTDGAQTIHPFYVRKIVEKIKDTGAYPFITDNPTAVSVSSSPQSTRYVIESPSASIELNV